MVRSTYDRKRNAQQMDTVKGITAFESIYAFIFTEVKVCLGESECTNCRLSLHGNQCLLSRLTDGTTIRVIHGALVEKVEKSNKDSQIVQVTLNRYLLQH